VNYGRIHPAPVKSVVGIETLEALDIRVGTIERVEEIPGSEKLMKLIVNFGDHSRTILAGIKKERENPREIEGRQALFVLNLKPRKMAARFRKACYSTSDTRMGSRQSSLIQSAPCQTARARDDALGTHGAHKIREETVSRRFNPRIVFDERQTEYVEIESNRGTRAFQIRKRIGGQQQLRLNRTIRGITAAHSAADELVAHPGGARGTDFFLAEFADAGALHLFQFQGHTHQDNCQRRHFHRGIPTIKVRRGIRFRYANGLRALHRLVEGAAFFDFRENNIGRGIEHPENPCRSVAGKPSGNIEKIGTPSITVASQRNFFFFSPASAVSSRKACTTGPLFAVMACAPSSSAAVRCSMAG